MKLFLTSLMLTISLGPNAQNKYIGDWVNYFYGELKINSDSTFEFTWNFHMEGSWNVGSWKMSNDTMYLTKILVYDTVRYFDTARNLQIDSLVLAEKQKPRVRGRPDGTTLLTIQNDIRMPTRLFYKKEILYAIDKKGKLKTNKFPAIAMRRTKRKYGNWFVRKSQNN